MCFTWLRRAVAHVFGDQVLLISNDPVLAFLWLLVNWVSSLFYLLLLFLCSSCSCVGVDNALMKGEIANTRLICALMVRFDEIQVRSSER
jgi:hypothetical protein